MSDSGGGPARPECAAPVRWARGVAGGCEPSPDTQVAPVERTALCPLVQGAPRPVGRQVHRGDAEKRNAFKKSLKHLEEAEKLDRLNPEVRRVAYSLGGGLGRLLRRYGLRRVRNAPGRRQGHRPVSLPARPLAASVGIFKAEFVQHYASRVSIKHWSERVALPPQCDKERMRLAPEPLATVQRALPQPLPRLGPAT